MSTINHGGDDSFASLFEKGVTPQRQRRLSVGDEVEGVVVKIGSDAVFLDLEIESFQLSKSEQPEA